MRVFWLHPQSTNPDTETRLQMKTPLIILSTLATTIVGAVGTGILDAPLQVKPVKTAV